MSTGDFEIYRRVSAELSGDVERMFFLAKLDGADFEVTDWEAQFIADLISNPRPLTPAQRATIDGLRAKYAQEMGDRI